MANQPQMPLRKNLTLWNAHVSCFKWLSIQRSVPLVQKVVLVFFYRISQTEIFYGFIVVTTYLRLYSVMSKAPTINNFKMLPENLKINCINMFFPYHPVNIAPKQLIEFLKRSLGADFLSQDYIKLFQLCVIYLGTDPDIYFFIKPAGISIARQMSNILYIFKSDFLSTQIRHLNIVSITTTRTFHQLLCIYFPCELHHL